MHRIMLFLWRIKLIIGYTENHIEIDETNFKFLILKNFEVMCGFCSIVL